MTDAGQQTEGRHGQPLELKVLDPLAGREWDRLLEGWPEVSVFHRSSWARVLCGAYGFNAQYFALFEGDRPVALMPTMEVACPLGGRKGVCLPFTDVCPLISASPESSGVFVREMLHHASQHGWRTMEWRSGSLEAPAVRPSLEYYAHRLSLERGEEQLEAGLDGSVRRAIRKAAAAGVKVEISHRMEAVRTYYRLHCQTRKRHGVPPQPFSFFAQIHQEIISQREGMVVTAFCDGAPAAAGVYLHGGRQAMYKFGASDERYQPLRVNNLVMWEAIKWYASRGFAELHFGRTSKDHDGLRRFKLGWGAREETLRYFRYDLRIGQFVEEIDRVNGWYNGVFRKLPIPVSRLVGGLLYRYTA